MSRRVISLVLISLLLALSLISCHRPVQDGAESTTAEATDVQDTPNKKSRIAQPFWEMYRVGDEIYFCSGVAKSISAEAGTTAKVMVTEYGTPQLEYYVPCFDPTCTHLDRSQCCLNVYHNVSGIYAYERDGEPTVIIYSPLDTVISKPYSNTKQDLLCEEGYVYAAGLDEKMAYLQSLTNYPHKNNMMVYEDYVYYSMLVDDEYLAYRVSLDGGEPERLFENDSVIIRTIVNDRFYGVKFNAGADNRDNVSYFRCDLNFENFETLPEIFTDFRGVSRGMLNGSAIVGVDGQNIYMQQGRKLWMLSDEDIYAPATMVADLSYIPDKFPLCYTDGTYIYALCLLSSYERFDNNNRRYQWFESSELFTIDMHTGEYTVLDISNDTYLFTQIYYMDEKYVYGQGRIVDEDGSFKESLMRLTIDTMKFEFIEVH